MGANDSVVGFPAGFLWGAAVSAYQVEGGNTLSDWWDWERRRDTNCVEVCGDACDHYHRYAEDISLLAGLGFNCFRFSIEWARIEPEEGRYSGAALDHYRRVLTCCHEHGLTPVVSFHHFTLPRWLATSGGWDRGDSPRRFAAYCGAAGEVLGDLLRWVTPINEPNMPPLLGYRIGIHPPGTRDEEAFERVTHRIIEADRAACDSIADVAPSARLGMSLSLVDWHLIDAPPSALQEHRHLREEVFFAEAQSRDFVGVQAYTRHRVNASGFIDPPEGAELTGMGYEYWPDALEATIRVAAAETGLPVFVTENGIATKDDSRRIDFIRGSLEGVARCSNDGLDVLGYCYWSALDNFEWEHGYGPRFGLIEVDRLTFSRRVKPSGVWLGEVARRNAL